MQTFTSSDGRHWPVSDTWAEQMNHANPAIRWNARATLERIILVLGDRPLDDVFGPGTMLDQIHPNEWSPGTCECKLQFLFDHHLAQANAPHEHIPHKILSACPLHVHLTDPVEHSKAVHEHHWAENAKRLAAAKDN